MSGIEGRKSLMKKVYVKRNGNVVETSNIEKGCVIRLIDPSEEEIRWAVEFLDVDEDFVLDPLDEDERARVDVDEDRVLVILKIPMKLPQGSRLPYRTTSMGIVLTPDYTLVVSKREVNFIDGNMAKFDIKKRSRMLFQILQMNARFFLTHLGEIQKSIDLIEEELHRSLRNKEIEELMRLEKGLVYFVTSLRSNELVMDRLLKGNVIPIYEEDRDILEDAIIDTRQAIDTANIFSDILAGMMDAYASIISNNLNIVMKILAVMTIILEIPTLLSSFYGMNVALPLQKDPHAFLHIIIWSAVSILLILFWFRKKRWI